MPHTRTTVQEVFLFDELDAAAKERARDWYRESPFDFEFDCEIDEFVTIGEAIGIDFDTHEVKLMGGKTRREPNIYWSVGYCQSDYAAFEGTYDYKATAERDLRAINDDDTWPPLKIAMALTRIQADNAFGIHARMVINRDHMYVSECYDRRNGERDIGNVGKEIDDLMERLARYLYQQLRDTNDIITGTPGDDKLVGIFTSEAHGRADRRRARHPDRGVRRTGADGAAAGQEGVTRW
jgi:hypothetical protein